MKTHWRADVPAVAGLDEAGVPRPLASATDRLGRFSMAGAGFSTGRGRARSVGPWCPPRRTSGPDDALLPGPRNGGQPRTCDGREIRPEALLLGRLPGTLALIGEAPEPDPSPCAPSQQQARRSKGAVSKLLCEFGRGCQPRRGQARLRLLTSRVHDTVGPARKTRAIQPGYFSCGPKCLARKVFGRARTDGRFGRSSGAMTNIFTLVT